YFDTQFDHQLKDKEQTHSGVALLIEIHEFKHYNDEHGYEAGDELLRCVATEILQLFAKNENALIAHLGGASFVVILPDKVKEVGIEAAQQLSSRLSMFKD